jgi:hypothetical protein
MPRDTQHAAAIEAAAKAMWEADDSAYVERAAREGRQVGRVAWEDATDPVTQPEYRGKARAAYGAARSGEAEGDGATVERVAAALWTKATEQEIERTGTDFNVAHMRYEDAEEWRKVWVRGQAQAVLDVFAEPRQDQPVDRASGELQPSWTLLYTDEDGWTVAEVWNAGALTNDGRNAITVVAKHPEWLLAEHPEPQGTASPVPTSTRTEPPSSSGIASRVGGLRQGAGDSFAEHPATPQLVRVWIDRQHYDFKWRVVTGARLRHAASIPDDFELWYEAPVPDCQDVQVPEDQGFALLNDARFYSTPRHIQAGAEHPETSEGGKDVEPDDPERQYMERVLEAARRVLPRGGGARPCARRDLHARRREWNEPARRRLR